MPKLQQYTAKGELTPSMTGVSALETAGRRISPLYDQAAQSIEKQGQAVSKIWNQLKFGLDVIDTNRRGGGGGGGKGGSVHDALDFGAKSGWGSGHINSATGGDLEAPGGGSYSPGQLNTRAHNEISSAAPNVASIAAKLVAGQGITDVERMELNATKKGNPYQDLGWWNTKTGEFDKSKNGQLENQENTEQAAAADQKANPYGFLDKDGNYHGQDTVDTGVGQGIGNGPPAYPLHTSQDTVAPGMPYNTDLSPGQITNFGPNSRTNPTTPFTTDSSPFQPGGTLGGPALPGAQTWQDIKERAAAPLFDTPPAAAPDQTQLTQPAATTPAGSNVNAGSAAAGDDAGESGNTTQDFN